MLRALALLVAAQLTSACNEAPASADKGPVVLAASSLQESLTDVAQAWAEQGHAAPVLAFAASSALARQVEGGAPADVFFSADEEWMDSLESKRLLRVGSRRDLLTNQLVLVSIDSPTVWLGMARELAGKRVAVADPDSVPAGRYAKAAFERLGLWDMVKDSLVPAENVRAALALVERGEVPYGVVYATDAKASRKVAVADSFAANSHPPIRYPIALLAGSEHPDAAAFVAFAASPKAQALFERRGFGIAP
ncbi:MAG: molybdate ABC transporter substrate-binding protein [Sphingomonadales bacterium 32-68-7]|nr:MAG: molybdate ABC transporter substrate-binding protein [Sphingomonadales bacterium 12-68-11]OYX09944.1 MAG: molybdate ABC transporter substrate-binding protein [Sphingomonadales bacterium 32-68-7]